MPEVHTPSQTIGPLYGFALLFDGSENMMPPGRPGTVPLHGRVFEGGGAPVPRVLIEAWHGDGLRFDIHLQGENETAFFAG